MRLVPDFPAHWSARDCRQFVALSLLAAGNVPLTASLGFAQWTVWMAPGNAKAMLLGLAAAILIFVDLVCVGTVLGRRTFKIKVGDNQIDATGEDAERVLANGDTA